MPLVAAATQFQAGAELLGGLASNPREPQAGCIATVLRAGCGQHKAGTSPLSYKEAPHGSEKGMLELNSALRQMLSVDLLEDLRVLLACGGDGCTPILVGAGAVKDTTTVLPYVVARPVPFRMAALGTAAVNGDGDERRRVSLANGLMLGTAHLEAILADDAVDGGAQQAYEHVTPAFLVKIAQYVFWRDQTLYAQWDPSWCAPHSLVSVAHCVLHSLTDTKAPLVCVQSAAAGAARRRERLA